MPNGDRTGPRGEGSRTGRGVGLCSGAGVAGSESAPGGNGRGAGRGCGRGRGGGRGRAAGGRNGRGQGFGWAGGPARMDASGIEALREEVRALAKRLDGLLPGSDAAK